MSDEVNNVAATPAQTNTTTGTSAADSATAAPANTQADIAPNTQAATQNTPEPNTETKSLLSQAGEQKSPVAEPNAQQTDAAPSTDAAAPAPYDFKLPEGVTVQDEAQFNSLKEVMQKSGVQADKAPELVSYLAQQKQALEQQISESTSKRQYEVWEKTNKDWVAAVMADPKMGGDNWKTTENQLGSLINKYGADIPTLRQTLSITGAGNNPDMIKFLFNISEEFKESRSTAVGKNANTEPSKSRASKLYNPGVKA